MDKSKCHEKHTDSRVPQLVHFFGPDGAGKSTQVEVLIRTLKHREPRIRKIWLRAPHTVAFLLSRALLKIGFYHIILNPFGDAIRLPAVNRNATIRAIWALLEYISVLPLVIRIRFLMARGYKCIAERYILDTVTTIAFFLGDIDFIRSKIARMLYRFIPKDTRFIFLDSDYETIFGRRACLHDAGTHRETNRGYGTIPREAVEPREFIEFQRTAYICLAESFGALTIDTSKHSVEDTGKAILEYLNCANRFRDTHARRSFSGNPSE